MENIPACPTGLDPSLMGNNRQRVCCPVKWVSYGRTHPATGDLFHLVMSAYTLRLHWPAALASHIASGPFQSLVLSNLELCSTSLLKRDYTALWWLTVPQGASETVPGRSQQVHYSLLEEHLDTAEFLALGSSVLNWNRIPSNTVNKDRGKQLEK